MAMTGRERDELRRRVVVRDLAVCHHCKRTGLATDDSFCPDCGFPQRGTEAEQRRFVVGKRKEKTLEQDHASMVRRARNFLLLAAGLNMLAFISDDGDVLLIGAVISSIFIGLSFWARKQAYPAILTGLLTYVTIQLFFGIFDWHFLVSGFIWKVAIVGAMYYALRSTKALEKKAIDGKACHLKPRPTPLRPVRTVPVLRS